MTSTATAPRFEIPTPEESAKRSIARETERNPIDLATVAQAREKARRVVDRCDRWHAGDRSNFAYGDSFTLTTSEARGLAYAAMAALGREDALDANGHPYRSGYPLGVPYYERPNVKVGPYVDDAVRHVLRDFEGLTSSDRDLVLQLALLANVSFRLTRP